MPEALAFPINRGIDADGLAMAGAKAYFYDSGTLNLRSVYTTSSLGTAHANPVVADSGGLFPNIFLDPDRSYRLILKTGLGVTIADTDPIASDGGVFTPGYPGSVSQTIEAKLQERVSVLDFGAVPGGSAAVNGPAFLAALAYLNSTALSGYGYGKGTKGLFIPAAPAIYDLGDTILDLTYTTIIEGETSAIEGGMASVLRWNSGRSGIRVQRSNTTGDTGTGAQTYPGGDASIIRRLALIGNGGATVTAEGEFHGIHARARCTVEDVFGDHWQGDLLHSDTSVSGNANLMQAIRVHGQDCRDTVFTRGGDSNAGYYEAISGIANRRSAVNEGSFIGNLYNMPHGAACARTAWNTGTPTQPCSFVSRGGLRYFVIGGQETGAATNAPKSSTVTITIASPGVVSWTAHGLIAGTQVAFSTTGALPTGLTANTAYYVVSPAADTFQVSATSGGAAINTSGSQSGTHTAGAAVDNTWWAYHSAGGVDATSGVPAWASGITVRAGGAYLATGLANTSTFIAPYGEIDQASQFDQRCYVVNPQGDARNIGVSAGAQIKPRIITATVNGIEIYSNLRVSGDAMLGSPFNTLGPIGTTIQDGTSVLGTRSTGHTIQYSLLDQYGTVVSSWLSVVSSSGFGRSNDFNGGLFDRWKFGGTEMLKVDSTGLQIGTGTGLTKAVVYTPSITPASVAAATVAEQTFTVTGLTTADKVIVNPPSISNATGIAGARISAADTLAIRFVNPTAGALTPTSGTYTVLAVRS